MHTKFSKIDFVDVDNQHLLGKIHSQLAGSVVDGPGWRYVVFMQGCQMRCVYCHNRDSWDRDGGELFSVTEVVEKILPYSDFFDTTHGGVTISGGEPLLQSGFVSKIFAQLKQFNIHTCLDTNGYWPVNYEVSTLDTLLGNTDLVMLDIKHTDAVQHEKITGISREKTAFFAHYVRQRRQRVRLRYVLVPGFTDSPDDIHALGTYAQQFEQLEKIELLPYHRLGVRKWNELSLDYALNGVETPSSEHVQSIKNA